MEFITENYVWFIIGAIVILMAVIGYIADKTDFGRKKNTEPKVKKERKEPKEEKIKIEAKGLNDLTQKNVIEEVQLEDNSSEGADNMLVLNDSLVNNLEQKNSSIQPDLMGNSYEILTEEPKTAVVESIVEIPSDEVEDVNNIDPTLFEPLNITEVTGKTEPVASEEDIWKF